MLFRERKRLMSSAKFIRLSLVVLTTGIASGLIGILCHYLLDFIKLLTFGNDTTDLLLQFNSVSAYRRFVVILLAGVLASIFWYFLQRRLSLLSISKAKKLVGKKR